MPIYDYLCLDCGNEFEKFHKVINRTEDVSCSNCASKKVRRQISLVTYPAWSIFLDKMEKKVKKKPWDEK